MWNNKKSGKNVIEHLKKTRKGAMFIIEAPSGTGKTTVIKELLRQDPNLKFSVSVTTRAKREGEQEGVDYYYISNEEYDKLHEQDAFYECVDSQYGSRYGTLKSEVDSFINVGQDVIFDLDWVGMRQMKEKAPDKVVSIYLLPPSVAEVKRRLISRGTDSAAIIERRMDLIVEKIRHWEEFDYVIVNVNIEETIQKVQRIISCERMKRVRQEGLNEFVESLIKQADEE
ncbi:MAG: guanylate kinase [Alphaproteobacteria bacterium]|nr:guanylate kinase [Alphaproteobacteria bacterium]